MLPHLQAQETVRITFEGPPPQPPGTAKLEHAYSESILWFVPMDGSDGFTRQGSNPKSFWPDNGSTYLAAAMGDSLEISANAGWRFDLCSVDLAEWSTGYPEPITARFTGYRDDGTSVTTNFTTDGVIDGTGPLADFETFYFGPEFSGLTRVELPGYGWSLDNVVISHLCECVGLGQFTMQPRTVNTYVPAATNITMTVSPSGTPPFTYQWRFNGVELPGATTSVLTITNAQPSDSGSYFVSFTNACGTAIAGGSFTVVGRPLVGMTPPLFATRFVGQGVTNRASVIGGLPLTWQWQLNGTNIPGATNSLVLVLTNIQVSSAGAYTLVVSNAYGTTTGPPFQLTVLERLKLVGHPLSQRAWVGETVTLEVSATGSPPIWYLWYKDGSSLFPFGTNAQLTLTNLNRRDGGAYACRVLNDQQMDLMTSNATLVVLSPQRLKPPASGAQGLLTFASGDADGGSLLSAELSGFELQVSTNLLEWSPLPGQLTLTNGTLHFVDTNSAISSRQRFFRIIEHVP